MSAVALRFVLLPGMDGTGKLFRPFLSALPDTARVRVVAYPSDTPLEYADLQRFVRDAEPHEGPYVVVAESFSGPAAIEFAATAPERLRGLVLCASFAGNPLPALSRWLRVLAHPALFRVPMPRAIARRLLVGGACSDADVDAVRSAIESVDAEVLTQRLRQVLDVDAAAALQSLEIPVLYLSGSHDRLIGGRGLAQVAAHVRDLTSVELDGPHLLLQTCADAAAREIVAFAGRVTDGEASGAANGAANTSDANEAGAD